MFGEAMVNDTFGQIDYQELAHRSRALEFAITMKLPLNETLEAAEHFYDLLKNGFDDEVEGTETR